MAESVMELQRTFLHLLIVQQLKQVVVILFLKAHHPQFCER